MHKGLPAGPLVWEGRQAHGPVSLAQGFQALRLSREPGRRGGGSCHFCVCAQVRAHACTHTCGHVQRPKKASLERWLKCTLKELGRLTKARRHPEKKARPVQRPRGREQPAGLRPDPSSSSARGWEWQAALEEAARWAAGACEGLNWQCQHRVSLQGVPQPGASPVPAQPTLPCPLGHNSNIISCVLLGGGCSSCHLPSASSSPLFPSWKCGSLRTACPLP